jgi:hypothetical protein
MAQIRAHSGSTPARRRGPGTMVLYPTCLILALTANAQAMGDPLVYIAKPLGHTRSFPPYTTIVIPSNSHCSHRDTGPWGTHLYI